MPRPNTIVPYRSSSVRVPIGALGRHPISTLRIFHHRAPVPRFFEMHKLSVRVLLRAPSGGQQIHKESKDVKRKNERDDPFENGGHVLFAVKGSDCEDDCKDDLHDDEHEFEPEGEAQDAVLAEVHAQALVLGADEDGADDVARDEEEEEAVVEVRVVEGVEDGEED